MARDEAYKSLLGLILKLIMCPNIILSVPDVNFALLTVIAPGFHTLYLEAMVRMFANCSERSISKLEKLLEAKNLQGGHEIELDLEAEFSNLALDMIGLGVFIFIYILYIYFF